MNRNSLLLRAFGEKPIAFNPLLARISGKATSGLFLSQLLYWHGKGANKEWVYKTIEEFRRETYLSRSEQDRAIAFWKQIDVIEVQLRGLPRKRYFRIDEERLLQLLEEASGTSISIDQSTRSAAQSANPGRLDCELARDNTESSSETTSKYRAKQATATHLEGLETESGEQKVGDCEDGV